MEDTDRLSGWKEVAAYLRKSVRSVQRWERELGLPVHRIKGQQGQVIYASRAELDAWLSRTELPADLPVEPAARVDEPTKPTNARSLDMAEQTIDLAGRRRAGRWAAVAIVLIVLLSTGLTWLNREPPLPPTNLLVRNQQVEAIGPRGEVLWTYRFDANVLKVPDVAGSLGAETHAVSDLDLDGDGREDRLVPIRFGNRPHQLMANDTLAAFTTAGRLIWTLDSPEEVTCDTQTFGGPWRIQAVLVSSTLPRRVWVSFLHHTWWPSFVMEVTGADGRGTIKYTQPGWVMSLTEWQYRGREVVAAGGVLNEHGRASVVVFDPNGQPTTLPSTQTRYRCGPPREGPVHAWLFPQLEVPTAFKMPYVMAENLVALSGHLRVDISTQAHFTLNAEGVVTGFELTDTNWAEHRSATHSLALRHPENLCPEPTAPKEIREWSREAGWVTRMYEPTRSGTRR